MEYPVWYKQSGFRFDLADGRVVYIDPWDVPTSEPKADFIFITHAHFDHFDAACIAYLKNSRTLIVAPADVARELPGSHAVVPGMEKTLEGLGFSTVPAYNIQKPFHPKDSGWVGYIINIDGQYWYHAGDTDRIPEMDTLHADRALLPIGGTYTMDVHEAIEAAVAIKPKMAIPMHYGFAAGGATNGETFKKLCPIPVMLLLPTIPFQQ